MSVLARALAGRMEWRRDPGRLYQLQPRVSRKLRDAATARWTHGNGGGCSLVIALLQLSWS